MKKRVSIILCFWVIAGLTSCNLPVRPGTAVAEQPVAQQYQTVSALLTQTARWTPSTPSGDATQPPAVQPVEFTVTPTPVIPVQAFTATLTITTSLAGSAIAEAPNVPCHLAQPGRPIDVTVPDETRFYPGEVFSKTWRLVNGGSCSWTQGYSVVWFSGDDLGINHAQPFEEEIYSGQSVDVTVDMIAPEFPGTYQSNWKLRDNQGLLFGIGPNGNSPFWVRIVVIPMNTPTITPTLAIPTLTGTPVVVIQGTIKLNIGDSFDMDQGKAGQAGKDDLVYKRSDENRSVLIPSNGARMAYFGNTPPGLEDCRQAGLSDLPADVEQIQPGTYFCYRSSQGLPGWLLLSAFDNEKNQLELGYLTWAVP